MKENSLMKRMGILLASARFIFAEKGLWYSLHAASSILFGYVSCKVFRSFRTFSFQGRRYRYFYHIRNTTWKNERTIEIPIVWETVRKYDNHKILEVGNVLFNYFTFPHDVVDKYEKEKGVVNRDIVDFHPAQKYDLIISISTLEHVGWDEPIKDPEKTLRTVHHLKSLLRCGGEVGITMPLGHNPDRDRLLREDKIQFTKIYCMERISRDNRWNEVSWESIRSKCPGSPFPADNSLLSIGYVKQTGF